MRISSLLLIALSVLLSSCGVKTAKNSGDGDTVPFRYSRLLTVVRHDSCVDLTIRNPWDTTAVLQQITVKTPIERAAVCSTVHASLFRELGCEESVIGLCDVQYIVDSLWLVKISEGTIADIGNSMEPNAERIIDLQPQLIFNSPYEGQHISRKLQQAGIPLLQCADYMEISPLARAEWIRLYGILLGREREADSIFSAVEKQYLSLKQKAERIKNKPTLLAERPYNGTWTVPCGGSTMGIMYHDAGARYIFADLKGTGSKALATEQILDKAINAQFWFVKSFGPLTRQQINTDFPALEPIKAKLYVSDSSQNHFFDEVPFHPDLLLENLISILHPELHITPRKNYFRQPSPSSCNLPMRNAAVTADSSETLIRNQHHSLRLSYS